MQELRLVLSFLFGAFYVAMWQVALLPLPENMSLGQMVIRVLAIVAVFVSTVGLIAATLNIFGIALEEGEK